MVFFHAKSEKIHLLLQRLMVYFEYTITFQKGI